MPPPERVIPDRRQEDEEREAEREMRDATKRPAPFVPSTRPRVFADRRDAGRHLAEALIATLDDVEPGSAVVLGIPRGGVEVAAEIADAMRAPLDVVIPRKLGAPGNPELGLGAIAEGVRVLDDELIRILGVGQEYLEREIADQEAEIRRRTEAYRGGRPRVEVAGRTAIVVDDGVATGGTATAALRWARATGAGMVVFAAPVAPVEAIGRLAMECDLVVVLSTPSRFYAVGQWYADFPQVSDERVIELLAARDRP